MKAYSATDLQSILDDDLIWRRRELSTLITTIKSQDLAAQSVLIRASIPMLYAHWEGYGKTCAIRYLEFVSYKRKKFSELKPSFAYLSLLPVLPEISKPSASTAIPLLQDLFLHLEKTNSNAFRKRVNTRSNLRFDVLLEIMTICGLDASSFSHYKNFINDEICDPRNEIAHGAGGAPTLALFTSRRNRAFLLMDHLKNEFVNAALEKHYMKRVSARHA